MRVRSEQQTAWRQVVESADELLPAGWFLWKERLCDQIHCSDAGGGARTTESYWSLLLMKHPEIAGRESDVQETLRRPDRVCRSRHDVRVHLFYRRDGGYHLCVVAKRLDEEGYIVTVYVTDSIKEGEHVWPTSA